MYKNFSEIENKKEFAYFLGLFWADGTINSGKYLVIEMLKDDANDIEKFIKKIFLYHKTERKREGRQPQTTFFIKDKELAEFLIDNGKYPHSVESHEKILKWIDDSYKVYFIRGLIDGDGCFYSGPSNKKWKNNTVHFTIGSSFDQNWDAIVDLFKSWGFKVSVIKREHKGGSKSSIIRSSNFNDIENFVKYLYSQNDEIWLKRKNEKIKFAILEHKKHIKESLERRKKFEIVFPDGNITITNNLKEFCREHNFCYGCVSKAANGNGKYKKIKIKKL